MAKEWTFYTADKLQMNKWRRKDRRKFLKRWRKQHGQKFRWYSVEYVTVVKPWCEGMEIIQIDKREDNQTPIP